MKQVRLDYSHNATWNLERLIVYVDNVKVFSITTSDDSEPASIARLELVTKIATLAAELDAPVIFNKEEI